MYSGDAFLQGIGTAEENALHNVLADAIQSAALHLGAERYRKVLAKVVAVSIVNAELVPDTDAFIASIVEWLQHLRALRENPPALDE